MAVRMGLGSRYQRWVETSGLPGGVDDAVEVEALIKELQADAPSLLPALDLQEAKTLWGRFEEVRDYYLANAPSEPRPLPEAKWSPTPAPFRILAGPSTDGPALTTLVGPYPGGGFLVGGVSFRSRNAPPTSWLEQWRREPGKANFKRVAQQEPESAPVSMSAAPPERGVWLTLIGELQSEQSTRAAIVEWAPPAAPRNLRSGLIRSSGTLVDDWDADGKPDLLFHGFGYHTGKLSLFWGAPDGPESVLDDGPGAMFSVAADLDSDGHRDFVTLISQHREEIVWFRNLGGRKFERRLLLKFHPGYGLSHLVVADFDGDGIFELAITNGDNSDFFEPPPRPDHGLRVYSAPGGWVKVTGSAPPVNGSFKSQLRELYSLPLQGAYQLATSDFDKDGDADIAVLARYARPGSEDPSFAYVKNLGQERFSAHRLPAMQGYSPMVLRAADLSGRGRAPDLLVGLRPARSKSGKSNAGPAWLVLSPE
ncbi:MAG: VCBS repeat-containing protein [Bdellovibrionales bacterium]|nr:VCBS repeat-containing protein [Bdellovibrionales bacterium]